MTDKRIFVFGPFTLSVEERTLKRGETDIRLSSKQFDLLLYLVENKKRLLKKESMLASVWPDEIVEERNLNKRVGELRGKLGRKWRGYIETVPKQGFRFNADVEERTQEVADNKCPWLGLRHFDESDARYYYGREAEIRELLAKLETHNFLAVVGSSGTGKSSLVRAGLIPALRLTGGEWNAVVLRPDSTPLNKLAGRLLIAAKGQSATIDEAKGLADRLRAHPKALLEILNEFGWITESKHTLIVVDQFEEVITQCEDPHEREQFISCLLSATSAPHQSVFVVITVRTDFYPKLEDYRELWSRISPYQYNVRYVDREQLRQVIVEPARVEELEVEDALITEILDDLGEGAGALPLLSHAMAELFKRRTGRRLTFAAYQATGKVKETVARHADEVYNSFGPDERELARRIFLKLVKVSEDPDNDVRVSVPLQDLAGGREPGRVAAVESVVRKLSTERLLTIRGGAGKRKFANSGALKDRVLVELAHEALIRHWQRLSDWLKPRRRARRIFVSLDISARDWDESGRKLEFLYSGSRLANALDARPEYEELMRPVHHEFLQASDKQAEVERKNKEKERRREESRSRLKRRFKILSVLAVILVSLFAAALWGLYEASRQRSLAESYGRAGASAMQEGPDPQLGLLLAIEAGSTAITPETTAVLRQALASSYVEAILEGHKAQVISVAVSSDGKYLLTAGADNEARLWDLEKKETVKILRGHTDWVNWAAFSPDGRHAVTASRDGTARIYDLSGDAVVVLRGHNKSVNNVVFSPNGLNVLTAGEDGTARIWDAVTGQLIRELSGHLKWINTAVYSPDGKLVVTASGDSSARVWDAATGVVISTLGTHTNTVLSASFSPDGKLIVTGSSDKTARVWEVGSWKEVRSLQGHTSSVNSVEFSRDGRWILTGSKDGTARLWNASTGYAVLDFRGHLSGVNTATFSPDGSHVYTASGDHTTRIWSVRLPLEVTTLEGHQDAVWSAVLSRDGDRIVTASRDKTVKVWETKTGKLLITITHSTPVQNSVFSPDGNLIASVSSDGIGRMWDSHTGKLLREFVGHQQMVHSINFSNDGTKIVTASKDRTARVWDATTGQSLMELVGHTDEVYHASFSPDGRKVATAGHDSTVRIWDVGTGREEIKWVVGTGVINSVSFDPSGKYLLAACGDQTARVWNVEGEQVVAVLRGHENGLNYAEFSPEGELIVTAGLDQTVRLWDFNTGRMLLQIPNPRGASMTQASFSHDGKLIAVSDVKGGSAVYACEICGISGRELLNLALKRKIRELTAAERARYLTMGSQ
jgi:WD40 repeat protein/DNA-binding winged helix-turn-helix (wHTH) protein